MVLSERVIAVTGAGRGIGEACARHAAAAGGAVVVNDIDAPRARAVAESIELDGGTAIVSTHDVSTAPGSDGLVRSAVNRFGRIDGLVNNAALFDIGRVQDVDPARASKLVQVNVLGPILCLSNVVRVMREHGWSGSIVNICSGSQAGIPHMSVYSATKGAVASLTYAAARELLDTAIRVNAVCPRGDTAMPHRAFDYLASMGMEPGSFMSSDHPKALDNAPIVTYLLSSSSAAINGQVIGIDGQSLRVWQQPSVVRSFDAAEPWTQDRLAEVFANELEDDLQPFGVEWPPR